MPQQSDTRRHHQQSDLTQTRCSVPTSSSFSALGSPRLLLPLETHKGNWAAASVICSRIEIPHPQYQRAIIIDEQTAAELHTTDSTPITFKQNEEYILIDDFSIEIIESMPMNTRPQMECTIAGIPTSQN
ncbi:hypothetical protein Pmani_009318 [Petrolisthes manimaculis]|uniref:Uncharacterized protein n=1 Tax=Petrolisthes manimaculis TaxID=1843537 RepID=A0AAE1Q516_9EUCA|nr:hypothetical protein Pmani_009318 [Petrolisthes manimaculis]